MAIRIISPQYSFVRFSDQHLDAPHWLDTQAPGAELPFILPVAHVSDYAFQWIAETDTVQEADDICNSMGGPGGGPFLMIVPGVGLTDPITKAIWDANAAIHVSEDVILNLGGGRWRLSPTQVLFYTPMLPDISGVPCGSCFQILFANNNIFDYGYAVSNWFNNICTDTDYTTVVEYYSDIDEVDFNYCADPGIKNRARLPIYMTRPLFPEEEDTYRLSSGKYKVNKSVVRKSYEVVTDQMAYWTVESLRAVFIHEFVFFETNTQVPQTILYEGEVTKDGAFVPNYVDYKNFPLATVEFRVNATDFQMNKNNCGVCPPPAYGLNAVDNHIAESTYTVNSIFQYDLINWIQTDCCSNPTFEITFVDPIYVQVANMVGTVLTIGSSAGWPPPPSGLIASDIVVVTVRCGSLTDTITSRIIWGA